MRNAIGAAWIFGVCIVFTLMFTAYMAISVNYANTNKFKSAIVSMVEENEGYTETLENRIIEFMEAEGYGRYGRCQNDFRKDDIDWQLTNCINSSVPAGKSGSSELCNICIYKEMGTGKGDIDVPRSRYRVVTFMKFDIPVVNSLLAIKVAGETKYFYDFASEYS